MKILLIGELAIDRFQYGNVTRINPECPTQVFVPQYITENKGMAGNVYNNLISLSPNPSKPIHIDFIHNKLPIIKTRFVDINSNYILLRIDEGDKTERISPKVIKKIVTNIKQYDAIVFSSYNKGFLLNDDIKIISQAAQNCHTISFIDDKKVFGDWSKNVDFIKINKKEYQENINKGVEPDIFCKKGAIITLGSSGIMYKNNIFKVKPMDVKDCVGAGDSVLAALVIKYLETQNVHKSIKFANKVGRIAVGKKGVAVINRKEIK